MKNLYRRYRPLVLEDVIGQEQVTGPLAKSLAAGKIGHAYLLVGPRGCGKTSVARILAHTVNGFSYEVEDDYVDIIEIDGASNRGIDNIRELREKVMIAPSVGKYKVYIIDEVHMLTKEAFNALLKTLEEPPAHAIFIMATTDAYKVPVTITSRAQVYTFKLADRTVMLDFLKSVCEKEGLKVTDEALEVIAKRGGGSFRDTLSLLDQLSTLSDGEITKEMVVAAMGLPEDEKIGELLRAYAEGDVAKITTVLKELLASGVKAETLTEEMIGAIVADPRQELMALLARLAEVKAPYAEARLLVALIATGSPEPVFSKAGLGFLSTSYAGAPREPSPQGDEPLEHVDQRSNLRRRDIHVGNSNQNFIHPREVGPVGFNSVEQQKAHNDEYREQANLSTPVGFDWGGFCERVRGMSEAIYSQLMKAQYEFGGGELHIYPMKKIVRNILARENNKRILMEAGEGVKITIHEADEAPSGAGKDETLNKISVIMGGEVRNDGGGNPFE